MLAQSGPASPPFQPSRILPGSRQNFARVGLAALRVPDHAIRTNQVNRALDKESARVIQRRHLLPGIYQQRKRQVVLILEPGVTGRPAGIDPEHLRIVLARLLPLVPELA